MRDFRHIETVRGQELNRLAYICGIKRRRWLYIFWEGDRSLRKRIHVAAVLTSLRVPASFGTPLQLATKQEIVDELTKRKDAPFIFIWNEEGKKGCIASNAKCDLGLPTILRGIADQIENTPKDWS
jgi:hypothetical protein